jgi:hypothetical protein
VFAELVRKRVKPSAGAEGDMAALTPGSSEHPETEKYMKISNQMNTNELQDIFMGRFGKLLYAIAKDRERFEAKQIPLDQAKKPAGQAQPMMMIVT